MASMPVGASAVSDLVSSCFQSLPGCLLRRQLLPVLRLPVLPAVRACHGDSRSCGWNPSFALAEATLLYYKTWTRTLLVVSLPSMSGSQLWFLSVPLFLLFCQVLTTFDDLIWPSQATLICSLAFTLSPPPSPPRRSAREQHRRLPSKCARVSNPMFSAGCRVQRCRPPGRLLLGRPDLGRRECIFLMIAKPATHTLWHLSGTALALTAGPSTPPKAEAAWSLDHTRFP